MITWCQGDMFDRPADIRVNAVNCAGVMGKGIAAQFKSRFPVMFEAYAAACRRRQVQVGQMDVFSYGEGRLMIINFPTKDHWRDGSKIEWIESGLQALRDLLFAYPDYIVTIPALGCQNGGLSWSDVKPLIQAALADSPANIFVYEPLAYR